MSYPGRHNIYDAIIRRMVSEALEQQEQEFRLQHQDDSDEQLLRYLCDCAESLHHTPWPGEIQGGTLIEERFGSWKQAVLLAKLSGPRRESQKSSFDRVRQETERQKEIYREKKAVKKQQAAQRRVEQARKKKRLP